MSTTQTTSYLTIDKLHMIMNRVEAEVIRHDEDSLESNPILNAASVLYNKLKAAAEKVSLEGAAALEEARDSVVREWDLLKETLGTKANELLALFQMQVNRLIEETMQAIAQSITSLVESGG